MGGGKRHKVQQGDSVESIAFVAGHFWETVWDHPENAALRKLRPSGHVLLPGDILFVPPLEQKEIECATGQVHPFTRKAVPTRLRIRFVVDDEPRAGQSFELWIDDRYEKEGTTDGDGWLDEPVSPIAQRAEVRFAADPAGPEPERGDFTDRGADIVVDPPRAAAAAVAAAQRIYYFDLRHLDPASEVSGLKGRLRLLGYTVGPPRGPSDALDERTRDALKQFQIDHDLEPSGELDAPTQAKLREFAEG